MEKPLLTLAHLSDPHYTCLDLKLKELLNKRFLGMLNFLFFRKSSYSASLLQAIPPILRLHEIDSIVLTGDFTSTSLPREYQLAKTFVSHLNDSGYKTLVIPGNHDCYTYRSHNEKRFYKYFPNPTPGAQAPYNLKSDRVSFGEFKKGIWWVALDTAISTPFFDSTGFFSQEAEGKLKDILEEKIPSNDLVILINHYPLYPPHSLKEKHRQLKRAYSLQKLLKQHPNVQLYLHGHNHTNKVINRQSKGFPVTVDAGSCSSKSTGAWNIIEIYPKKIEIAPFFWDCEDFLEEKKWLPGEQVSILLHTEISQ